MNISEELYILYRRIKAAASWSIYLLFAIFPIKKNKIVFSAFEGGGYGCNPKYIAKEIIRRMYNHNKQYELIWLVNDTSKNFPKEIRAVKNNLWNRAYHLSTAKVWIDNARKNYGTRKREGQYYMQTWHGPMGVKPVGRVRGKSFTKIAQIVTRYDAALENCFLINSKYALINFRNSFYNEPLIKTGSPRCDILVNEKESQHEKIRRNLHLSSDVKLVMYAPTFRGGSQNKVRGIFQEKSGIDFQLLKLSLEKQFGGNWHILLRLHPQLALRNNTMNISDEFKRICTDISLKDDMYEYLAAVDAFVTDYSSASVDAAVMRIPVFVYADDLDNYINDRGSFIRDIYEFPFPVAKTNEELRNNIINFDETTYLRKVNDFFESEEVLEDGEASKRAVDIIENYLNMEVH